LKEPDAQNNKPEHDSSITVETAIIEQSSQDKDTPEVSKEAVSEPQVPRLSSRDSFHGLK
jgi:hypothetical protein